MEVTEKDAGWRRKAHTIIGKLSLASYLQANTTKSGKRRKRHVPYSIPETAETLVQCLNRNDEARAKSIFLEINDREIAGLPFDEIAD